MKVLSLNFLTCAVKACKTSSASYPLHPKDAELVQDDIEVNPLLLINLLPRIDWSALSTTATEVSLGCILMLYFPPVIDVMKICKFIIAYMHTFTHIEISMIFLIPTYLPTYLLTLLSHFGVLSLTREEIIQLGFPALPPQPPTTEELQSDEKTLRDLHNLLMETQIMEGKLVCGNCGHEYAVREGIANFLLPSHLV